ncbi:MAG: site-2 protease family protein [Pedosphaera sp.]|nr:site-2 protease family protein [Pedosphaera sp.]
MACFLFVMVIWVFSVCLHEFGHAWVAERGGDYTVREKGYLSMNPVHYVHPVTSFLLPMLIMAFGGIGLPGGAVYIERHLLRSRAWETGVSLAGPAMNLLLVIISALALRFVLIPYHLDNSATYATAFILKLQISAVLLNLLPIPPLDGFHAIEPHLSSEWRESLLPFANYGLFALFILFQSVPAVNRGFWLVINGITTFLGVDPYLGYQGFFDFQFWKHGSGFTL